MRLVQLYSILPCWTSPHLCDPHLLQLYEACKEDSVKLGKDVKNGGGRVQACLVGVDRCRPTTHDPHYL